MTVDMSEPAPLGQHNENAVIVGTTPNEYNKAIVGSVFALEIAKISKSEVLNNVENGLVYISTSFPSIDEIIKVVAPNDEKKECNHIYRKNNQDCYCFKAVSFIIMLASLYLYENPEKLIEYYKNIVLETTGDIDNIVTEIVPIYLEKLSTGDIKHNKRALAKLINDLTI